MDSPKEGLKKLSEHNSSNADSYSLFAYYLNADLINLEDPNRLFGIIIPCGEYPTEKKAKEAQTKLSARTNVPNLVYCCNNRAFPLNPIPDKNTVVYPHNVNASVNEVEASIEKERERMRKVQQRLEKEIEEREDHDSMSYFINKMYRLATCEYKIEQHKKMIAEAKKAKDDNFKLVVEYVAKHPEAMEKWKEDARARFLERGELDTYVKIMTVIDGKQELIEEQAACLSINRRPSTGSSAEAPAVDAVPVAPLQLKHKFKAPPSVSPVLGPGNKPKPQFYVLKREEREENIIPL